MDEKTEELRDLFVDITDESTVTEEQEESPGSLGSEESVDERLQEIVGRMRAKYEFSTSLSDEELVTVVKGFYADDADAEIARRLDGNPSEETVSQARTDLHLLRDRDLDAPFDLDALRELLADGADTATCAAELDVSESTVRRYRRVVEAQNEARRANERFQSEFENVLHDRELSDRMTEDIQQDGLEDATEGMETDVSF